MTIISNTLETEKLLHRRSLFSGRSGKAAILVLILGITAMVFAPLAQAATHTYASERLTPEGVRRESGQRPMIAGGNAFTEPWSADGAGATVFFRTYYVPPGGVTVNISSGGGEIYATHPKSANARQQCWWDFEYSTQPIGSLKTTCRVLY